MVKIQIGRKVRKEAIKEIDLPENKTTTPNMNYLCLATQGSGKTNLIMLFAFLLYTTWKETSNAFGALPIIFAPGFEWLQFENPSKNINLPPEIEPQGVGCIHLTFPICDPLNNPKLQVCSFDFSSMDASDILGFTDIKDEDKYLGAIKKLIERIIEGYEKGKGKNIIWIPPREFSLNNFIDEVKDDASLKDALYYVFTELKKANMFDTQKYQLFNIREMIQEKKPIIIHFGDMNDRQKRSGIAGLILKQLWQISNEFYNAYLKNQGREELTEWETFLLENWTIALFVEEAHQILYATKSGGMALESKHPCHYWFKNIAALQGRKRMFKYNFLISQKFMELFYGIRTSFNELIIGDTVYPDDKLFLETDLKIRQDHVGKMTRLPRFAWTFIDLNKYQKRKKHCASKVRVFLSPAGQPE